MQSNSSQWLRDDFGRSGDISVLGVIIVPFVFSQRGPRGVS